MSESRCQLLRELKDIKNYLEEETSLVNEDEEASDIF